MTVYTLLFKLVLCENYCMKRKGCSQKIIIPNYWIVKQSLRYAG